MKERVSWSSPGKKRLVKSGGIILAGGLVLATLASPSVAEDVLVRLIAPLDEPRGLCLDIPGHRDRVRLNAPLMVHTCKWGMWNFDERFDKSRLALGQLVLPHYGLCLVPRWSDGRITLAECEAGRQWTFDGSLLRSASKPDTCITVGPESSELTRGGRRLPSKHVARSLGLEPCQGIDRQKWELAVPEGS